MTNLVEFPAGASLTERVAEEVRALMGRRRMNQTQLGSVLGMSQASASERLRGKTPFTLDDVSRLAAHFDVSVASLLGYVETFPTPPGRPTDTARYRAPLVSLDTLATAA